MIKYLEEGEVRCSQCAGEAVIAFPNVAYCDSCWEEISMKEMEEIDPVPMSEEQIKRIVEKTKVKLKKEGLELK